MNWLDENGDFLIVAFLAVAFLAFVILMSILGTFNRTSYRSCVGMCLDTNSVEECRAACTVPDADSSSSPNSP